ncbi:MAG: protease [Planctomycetia bacterium]|nr:protease [Planctomycetia bacterium]
MFPLLLALLAAPEESRLLRFPTINGENIVFTYAGDLYTVAAKGGVARRLTTHEGFEMFPRFSPNGKQIAFTGQYDGNTEIYVIPAEGGEPKRLSYTATLGRDDVSDRMGPNNICMGWTPDGKNVVFRSRQHSFNDFIGQLYTVPVGGGLSEQLPLPRGGFCSYSPDGKKLAYNRVFREFRTWKRYRGGMADDIWLYDFETKQTTQLTKTDAQEIQPMWYGDHIYFVSDREPSGRLNLYKMPAKGGEAIKLTNYQDFDVKFPSLGDKAIVFEQGGYIWTMNLETDKAERVKIRILEDRAGARTKLQSVGKDVNSYEVSPDGNQALFGARGDVFTVPAKAGPTRNLTNTPGVHERNAKWSPDGKHIAYISDKSGEDEIWISTPEGNNPTKLTTKGDTYKYALSWSPDSSKIMWTDKKLRVAYVEVATKKVTQVVQSPVWEVRDAVWSPDSKWIAWSQDELEGEDRVLLYSVEQSKSYPATDGRYASTNPCFSGDGKYLFFVSARDFNPVISRTEWNHAYTNMSRLYAVILSKDTPSPFLVKDETEKPAAPKEPAKKEPVKKDEKPTPPPTTPVKIDTEGLIERTVQLGVKPGNYGGLQSVGNSVWYMGNGGFGVYDVAAKKDTSLGSIGGYEISADGKKMLVAQAGKYAIIDLPRAPVAIGDGLNLGGMEVTLDRKAEWKQMFHECWRQMRDFFYDPNMHGVDWKAMRDRYEPLVEHVAHRADLTYLIGEMISELNAGHAYVGGGDMVRPSRLPLGLLGAKLKFDSESKLVQIVKVLRGSSWDPSLKSPLAEIGLNVKDGDWIQAVDGQSVATVTNLYELLVNKAGKQVKLTIATDAKGTGSRTITILPIASEADLYYHDWVEGNLAKVEKATGGKVGYLHVPDMLTNGLNHFARYYYPQIQKKALIVDMRGNGGGNVSPMLIERLRREAAMITIARNSVPRVDPGAMIYGPMCCLLNEFSASDGDLFPYRFRQHKLGKLIGKRSWGGVVGIRGTLPLLDGGTLNRPEFSRYDLEGKEWIIEGKGVEPDIEVGNDPAKEFAGEDEQLNAAIKHILDELKEKEKKIPPPPPSPKR